MAVEVGVRELRNKLSQYLERVQAGDEVLITDRGRAIARVLPLGGERTLDRLIAEGVVTRAKHPKQASSRATSTGGTVSDLVAEQRR